MDSEITEIQIACFQIGSDTYAVDIMRVKEIIRPQKLTALPKAPAFVEGVANLRGAVIPVIDLRKRFEMPPPDDGRNRCLLIVTLAGSTIGLAVDEVTEVITIPVVNIKPPPQVAREVDSAYLLGVCLVRDSLVMLLNPDLLLSGREAAELGTMNEMPAED